MADPDHFEFDIYEQQDNVGGTWKYSDRVGSDEFGLPVHSSMYTNLRTNLPKETMAFPDFPFRECGGMSFLHHTQVLQYLEDYAKFYSLHKYIKFHKLIKNVRPLKHGDSVEWSVSFSDVITKEKETYIYDAVMVCNGHYSVPYMPDIVGLNTFRGLVVHSHDYREPDRFGEMRVVVLGAGASGIDIAIELCSKAKQVVMSHNNPPKTCPFPDNMEQERGIESVDETSVTFYGGRRFECDALLICTGYLYHYPFLDPECGLKVGDQRVTPLFLHLFLIEHPSLAIWAVPKLILPFPIYDQQVKLFLKVLLGAVRLPSSGQMRVDEEADFRDRLSRGMKPRHAHVMPGEVQWRYDDRLSALAGIPPLPDAVRSLFRHVHHTRTMDFVHYKDAKYRLLSNEKFQQVE